jgi:thiol-disulfide isomerase/thioredoxin
MSYTSDFAQVIKELHIGDTVTNVAIHHLLNYPKKDAKLGDFKGKLLILDIWGTNCAGCIRSWPKLLEMQKKYEPKMQIVLVDPWDGEKVVKACFERRKKLAQIEMTLPASSGDSSFKYLFPVNGIPTLIWINADGVITNIAGGSSMNTKNIETILSGQRADMGLFTGNLIIPYNDTIGLYINGNGGRAPSVYWQSILTPTTDSFCMNNNLGCRADGPRSFVNGLNSSISELYSLAYTDRRDQFGHLRPLPENLLHFKAKNPAAYYRNLEDKKDGMYSYNLLAPKGTSEADLLDYMKADLKRYFHLHVNWVLEEKLCLVLRASDTTLIRYKTGEIRPYFTFEMVDFNNEPMSYFVDCMEEVLSNYSYGPYPLIDETGFKGNLGDFSFETDMENWQALNRSLAKYKMTLTLEKRKIKILELEE